MNDFTVKPITPHYNSGNRKPYEPIPEANFENDALKRYAALSQMLFDALVPFVAAYEQDANLVLDSKLEAWQLKHISVTLGQIRTAQHVLRAIATDIYV